MRRSSRPLLILCAVLLALPALVRAQSSLVEAAERAKADRARAGAGTPAPVVRQTAPARVQAPAPAPATAPAPAPAPATRKAAPAPATATPIAERGAPFLWKIDGPVPTYLFGTIHVPDARVLALPPSVEAAFAAADIVYTELPMDAATQMVMLRRSMLPDDRSLTQVIGQPLFDRLARRVDASLTPDTRAVTGPAIAGMMDRLKPWAAMTMLSTLEFLPDQMAGRQPLDAMLYTRAQKEGKQVAALETVDEQLAVFDGFSDAEQTRMLTLTLDDLDAGPQAGRGSVQEMVTAYLSGDIGSLTAMMNASLASDPVLSKRLLEVLLDNRNVIMADRMLARRAAHPDRVAFFAVGAGHYAGERGILALLAKKGLKATRLSVQ